MTMLGKSQSIWISSVLLLTPVSPFFSLNYSQYIISLTSLWFTSHKPSTLLWISLLLSAFPPLFMLDWGVHHLKQDLANSLNNLCVTIFPMCLSSVTGRMLSDSKSKTPIQNDMYSKVIISSNKEATRSIMLSKAKFFSALHPYLSPYC